jgi:homocitrate synthase NifV
MEAPLFVRNGCKAFQSGSCTISDTCIHFALFSLWITHFSKEQDGFETFSCKPLPELQMTDFSLIGIIDSTLREGEQTPGVNFRRDQKLQIVQHLVELGVEEIEIGVASPRSPELCSLVAEAASVARGTCRISLWSRCLAEDIRFASRCRPDTLSLCMPVSDIHLQEKLGRNRSWVLENLNRSIATALELGFATVSVGLEDATRAAPDFLRLAVEVIERSGASRIRLADTVGIASPGSITRLIEDIREIVIIPIGIHTHNDFGMATANAVAALEAGAQWADATVLGLGERAGNCRLEELVGYLSLGRGVDRYRPEGLKNLCSTVADAAGIAIPAHHPLVGDKIFTCETGLHVQGLAANPQTYEPYDPLRIGRSRSLLFGGKTGRGAVRERLATLGYTLSEKEAEELVIDIRTSAETMSRPLDEHCLEQLARTKGMVKSVRVD